MVQGQITDVVHEGAGYLARSGPNGPEIAGAEGTGMAR